MQLVQSYDVAPLDLDLDLQQHGVHSNSKQHVEDAVMTSMAQISSLALVVPQQLVTYDYIIIII
jgi:hypothetical protein